MDEALVDAIGRAQRGDATAFDEVVRAYATPLVRFTVRLLGGDVHAAHDVVQETFVATWRALPRLTEPRFLRAWLYQVAYHRAISWIRRRGPFLDMQAGLDPDGPTRELPVPERVGRQWNVGGTWRSSDEVESPLYEALATLPPRYAAPITLFYLEGVPAEDVAKQLGLAFSTFKMRLHRGRGLLRTRILERLEAGEWAAQRVRARAAMGAGPPPPPLPAPRSASSAPSIVPAASAPDAPAAPGAFGSRPAAAPDSKRSSA